MKESLFSRSDDRGFQAITASDEHLHPVPDYLTFDLSIERSKYALNGGVAKLFHGAASGAYGVVMVFDPGGAVHGRAIG